MATTKKTTKKTAATSASTKPTFKVGKQYTVRDRAGQVEGTGKYVGSDTRGWHTVNMAPPRSRTSDNRKVRASQLEAA